MRDFIAIDPGAEHCGYCVVKDWEPVTAWVLPPVELFEMVSEMLDQVNGLVVEEYRVLDDSANRYGTLETVEAIGVLKYLASLHGLPVIMQQTAIKKPMKGWLMGHGVKSIVPRRLGELRNHAVDAELHAWHHILRDETTGEWRKRNA